VTKIGWHPEGPTKLVGSYSNLRFQRMTDEMPMASFIWDISERNVPLTELRSATPLVCCQYNQRNSDWMVGGCYNGLLNYYDLRKGPTPVLKSAVEVSHWDPVYDVVWMQSKTNRDCASVSSDGRLLFWDVAMMNQTIDSCVLTDGAKEEPKNVGGVSLEWMQEAGPTKFLVGTEHGVTLSCSRKPKKAVEIGTWFGQEDRGGYGRHFGPVYSVKRNPFHTKFFLTVGDWCTKMWMEELKGPLLQTPYYPSFLSAASWSPTRPGVFFLCRADGRLDTWDYYYRMNEASLSQKVTDSALTSLSVQNGGQFAAVGDSEGVITLLQLCDGLVQPMPNEKNMIGQLFEREQKREKNLEQIKRQGATQKGHKEDRDRSSISIDQNEYQQREKTFFHEVGMTGEELGTTPLKPGGAART
jgi:dynein intermediate chain 2